MSIHYLPLRAIQKNRNFLSFFLSPNGQGLSELQDSIESDGLLNPIFVVRNGNAYEVIDGQKRLNVIRRLSNTSQYKRRYSKVPCLIKEQGILDIRVPSNKPLLLNDQELAHNILKASRGQSPLSKIAKRYACDLSVALQCLNLKNLNRDILKLFSKGTLSLDQAAAFSSLKNKKKQAEILLKIGPSASARKIMKAVDDEAKHLLGATRNDNCSTPYHNTNMKSLLAA